MEKVLINGSDFNEFIQIIVNVDQESMSNCIEEKSKEETKKTRQLKVHYEMSQETPQVSLIFSIKDITKNKSELGLIELIRNELGIVENDASVWKGMVCAISQVSISSNNLFNGKKVFTLRLEICWHFRAYVNNCKIDQGNIEIISQMPVGEALKSRAKGQRLTFDEKSEIFDQINNGEPTRNIKELMQISDSTI